MAKLYFKTGCMNSGKSTRLLQSAYQYESNGQNVICLKPCIDTRDGENTIKSRLGIERKCFSIKEDDNVFKKIRTIKLKRQMDIIMIDEAQFLSEDQINQLQDVAYEFDIPVLAYGLKTDFTGKLFPASKRLMEIADDIHEEKSVCWCGKKAKQNARVVDGKMVVDGELVQIGGNESYVALCNKHFREKNLG